MGACAVALLAALPALSQPVPGFMEYSSTFKVQRPYNIPVDQRFNDSAGIYTTLVYPNDKPFEVGNPTEPRTEMRWETWIDQKSEHMFEADVMYESGCANTCIHQVKSNVSGEAVYMRVLSGGDLIDLTNGQTVLKQGYGKWFNLRTAYNPVTHLARVWIDGVLKTTDNVNGRDWYFKNGTYTVAGKGPAMAHFKNIRLRVPGTALEVQRLDLSRAYPNIGAPGSRVVLGNGASILPLGQGRWEAAFDLRGKAAAGSAAGVYFTGVPRK
jgi:hypothetical protein